MKKSALNNWFFGKTGGLISPEVKSPWGILLLSLVIGFALWRILE